MSIQGKFFYLIVASGALLGAFSAAAAGFGLYEGSARGNAMGGAVMGKALDASANYYNPATMTDLTGTVVTVGMTTEHPKADALVNGRKARKLDPGCFVLPHFYLTQELPQNFWFGLGVAPEYGLGTHYHQSWPLAWDTRSTTIKGLTVNPNLAYKVTDDWSVSAGFRLSYFEFEQYSDKMAVRDGVDYGTVRDHLKGYDGFLDWGWQISTKYDITKKLSVGLLYKSYIDTKVKGYNHTHVRHYNDAAVGQQVEKGVEAALQSAGLAPGMPGYQQYYDAAYQKNYPSAVANAHRQVKEGAADANGSAQASLRLPQSLSLGLNYDVTDDWHVGAAATWIQWSTLDSLYFDLPGDNDREIPLKWNDTWRYGFGVAYDVTQTFTLMGSWVYDIDPCSKYHCTSMLPPGSRQIMTFGFAYRWRQFELTASYGLVFMNGESTYIHDDLGTRYRLSTRNGLSHAAAVTLSYFF